MCDTLTALTGISLYKINYRGYYLNKEDICNEQYDTDIKGYLMALSSASDQKDLKAMCHVTPTQFKGID